MRPRAMAMIAGAVAACGIMPAAADDARVTYSGSFAVVGAGEAEAGAPTPFPAHVEGSFVIMNGAEDFIAPPPAGPVSVVNATAGAAANGKDTSAPTLVSTALPPDIDCKDVGGPVLMLGPDPNGLDADHDGIGCE